MGKGDENGCKSNQEFICIQKHNGCGKGNGKGGSVLAHADSRVRNDEIHISSEAMKKQEAAKLSSSIHKSMDAGAGPKRLAQIKQQVQDGSYQVSAELIARRLMSGL